VTPRARAFLTLVTASAMLLAALVVADHYTHDAWLATAVIVLLASWGGLTCGIAMYQFDQIRRSHRG
jgi:hypothetical protein